MSSNGKSLKPNYDRSIPRFERLRDMKEPEKQFYDKVRERAKEWKLIEEIVIPKAKGRAFIVKRGQIFRVIEMEGPQCADLNVFNLYNPKERFHQGCTRVTEGAHPSLYAHLWSDIRPSRPMLTIIEDTAPPLSHELLFGGGEYAGCHSSVYAQWGAEKNSPNCTDNFIEAVKPFGLGPNDVHQPFNIWMNTGLDMDSPTHSVTIYPTTAKKGDRIGFFAEMDCIAAVTSCASGGFELYDRENQREPVPKPLKIEIYNPEFVRLTKTFYRIV